MTFKVTSSSPKITTEKSTTACKPAGYLGGDEEIKFQCELCKYYYWVFKETFNLKKNEHKMSIFSFGHSDQEWLHREKNDKKTLVAPCPSNHKFVWQIRNAKIKE